MSKKIDYDRGVMIRTNPSLGMDVFMYFDDPGVYLNAAGRPVPPKMAEQAGFDIARWAIAKKKRDTLSAFKEKMEAADYLDMQAGRKVIADRDGFKLIALPSDRACIEDPDGTQFVPPGPVSVVTEAFNDMFPEPEQSEFEKQIDMDMPKPVAAPKKEKASAAKE